MEKEQLFNLYRFKLHEVVKYLRKIRHTGELTPELTSHIVGIDQLLEVKEDKES